MQSDVGAQARELPLFPLNVVLFPNQSLPLHIFEPRYRIMIQRCMDNKEPFGVVLALDESRIADIGTATMITQMERMEDGRMDINTLGTERFRVQNWSVGADGYLIGNVVDYPFAEPEPPDETLVRRVTQRMRRYLRLLAKSNGMRFQVDQFPSNASQLAIFSAIALQIEIEEKQALLEQASVAELLTLEDDILADEIKILYVMSNVIQPPQDDFIFSRN